MTKIDVSKVKNPEDILKIVSELPPEVIADFQNMDKGKEEQEALFQKYFAPAVTKEASNTSKQAASKAKSPEAAKKMFQAYKKRHPSTTKKWDDFYEKSDAKSDAEPKATPTLSKEDTKNMKSLSKKLVSPEIKKSFSPVMHKNMEKMGEATTKQADQILKNPTTAQKLENLAVNNPAKASLVLLGGLFVAAMGTALAFEALSELPFDGLASVMNLKTPEGGMDAVKSLGVDFNKIDFGNNPTIKMFDRCVTAVMAGTVAAMATKSVMKSIHDKEKMKPEDQQSDALNKFMGKKNKQ